MNEIPSVNLQAQYLSIKDEIDHAIARVLQSGRFILGEEVTRFEAEFAQYIGTTFAVGVSSGTDALELALRACGIQAGDEVITAANTAVATVAAIEQAGAQPVLVDVDPCRFTIDPELIKRAITAKTRAIIPVHLYGCPADLAPILDAARRHNVWVIEDCAQAHGAAYQGRRVGAWGDAGAFSFYPTKNLGAFGDGGAVVTSNPQLAEKLRLLRQYGWEQKYVSKIIGTNSRLDDLQAAILRVKLTHLEKWNCRRRWLADLYHHELSRTELILPYQPEQTAHVYHQYAIRSRERDELRARLHREGIQTQVLYPVPVHLQPAYNNLGYEPGDFPVTEQLAKEILALPIYPELEDVTPHKICRVILQSS